MSIFSIASGYRALSVVLLLVYMLTMSGCTAYPQSQHGEVNMDDWCAQDATKPWTGCWEEIGQIDCSSGDVFEPENRIGEFRLRADGHYSVTRHPFEHFVDYSGVYTATGTSGTIAFSILDRPGFDGDGTYSVRENGDLVLHDVWFDIYQDSDESGPDRSSVSCGYVFHRN